MDDEMNVGTVNTVETEENASYNNKNDDNQLFKKKILKIFAIVFLVMVGFLLILFIVSVVFKKTYSYAEIEDIMKDSAIEFYEDNKKELPKDEKRGVMIESDTLIESGYMKDFSKYSKDAVSCTGTVTVKKSGEDYIYTPKLDCGEDYTTTALKEHIFREQNVVVNGYGLYSMNNSYVFRGEKVDNYVSLDKKLWRIVKINNDGTMMLILNDKISVKNNWDNRYNIEKKYEFGVNDYSKSRIKELLDKYYNNGFEDDIILSNDDKLKLTTFNACVGKRNSLDTSRDGSVECSQVLEKQSISLLTAYDYMNASVDVNCINTTSPSCQNYNYLNNDYSWWLLTAPTTDTYSVYYVASGVIEEAKASLYKVIRPVVYLRSDVLYVSGNGTEDSPYVVR